MSLGDVLFGRRLASHEDEHQRVGTIAAIPMLGLDALASAAYGPEAALTLLLPLGILGLSYILPISLLIIFLLCIVYLSYRQTIAAYPTGGGSYTVARSNLGASLGLLAAAALLLDYILVVAIGISAGIGALVSALPVLQPYTLKLCLVTLAFIALVNLRGVRESGVVFLLPTYLFVATLFAVLAIGVAKTLVSHGSPAPVVTLPHLPAAAGAASLWLLLQSFASGCTAMTGVEAISNGVTAFREPRAVRAQRTLTAVILILIMLLAGIAYLARAYGIGATEPGREGYESVLSQLVAAVVGRGVFYYVTIAAILSVLALSANTGFADFPRLCRVIAQDGYLPRSFASRGRRLVYSEGIYVLTALAALLLIIFGGITDRLIPLFAVGAFLAFTLSQAGMVVHWQRTGGVGAWRNMVINGAGAAATGVTLLIVLIAKFAEGAWVTMLLIPGMLFVFVGVRRHYRAVARELACPTPLDISDLYEPVIIVPISAWNKTANKALRFALKMSPDIYAVHVRSAEHIALQRHFSALPKFAHVESRFCGRKRRGKALFDVPINPCVRDVCSKSVAVGIDDLQTQWDQLVEVPTTRAGLPVPQLVVIDSPYRRTLQPILDYVLQVRDRHPDRQIAVIIPELVESRWYQYFLHNQRAQGLKALLLFNGGQRVVVINVPWYLSGAEE